MLSIKDNGKTVICGECEISIPQEFWGKEIKSLFATATHGLKTYIGYISNISQNGEEVKVVTRLGPINAKLYGYANITDTVIVREQFCVDTGELFFIATKKEIGSLNWINIKFNDNQILRLCPFTYKYAVYNG